MNRTESVWEIHHGRGNEEKKTKWKTCLMKKMLQQRNLNVFGSRFLENGTNTFHFIFTLFSLF